MANVTITDLPSLSTMTNVAVVPVVAGNVTQQITGANLKAYFTTNIANLSVTGDIVNGGDINSSGNIDIDGDGTIGGNLFVTGNINFSGNVNQISGNSGSFYGNATTGLGALYAGIPVGYSNVGTAVLQMTTDLNDYTQVNAQNLNHGNTSSMEYVVTGDLGTDTTDYIDIGFSSSTWDGTQTNSLGTAVAARDGWMYVQGGGGGGNLILGTTTAGRSIKFNVGGPNTANTVGELSSTGLSLTGNVQAGNLRTAGLLSVTGTITASSTISTSGTVIGGASLQATGMTGLYSGTTQADTIGSAKTTGTITIGGPNQTGQISLAPSTASQNILIGSGATGSGNTKLINIGGSGTANSITNFFVGPTTSAGGIGQFNIQNATQVGISNTGALALSVAGTVTGAVLAASGQTSFSSLNTGIDSIGVNKTTGTITLGSLSQTGNIVLGTAVTANSNTFIQSGALTSGLTKTISIGQNGLAGSTLALNIGPTAVSGGAGFVTFANNTTVAIASNSATALSVVGNITAGNIITAGAISATGNITNGNITATSNLTVGGGTFLYSSATTTDVWGGAKTSGGINIGATGQTGAIQLGLSTLAQTVNIANGVTASGNIKVVNIGTSGASGSTTNIAIGPTSPGNGAVSFASGTTVLITNTGANALVVSGTVTGATVTATSTVKLPVFANTTIRDITIPTPATGMMVFVTGTGMQIYGATQWNTIAGTAT